MDEFLYATQPGSTVASVVSDNLFFRTRSHISVRWKMFGSSGFLMQPTSIICSFTHRRDEGDRAYYLSEQNVKSGVAVRHLQKFGVHTHSHWNANFSRVITPAPWQRVQGETNLKSNLLQLNHYPIQSLDWFRRIKMTRGSASTAKYDNVRNEAYFHAYDHNQRQDTALLNQTESCTNDKSKTRK